MRGVTEEASDNVSEPDRQVSACWSRQLSPFSIEAQTSSIEEQIQIVSQNYIKGAVCEAIRDCSFCVTVADPRLDDSVLIAVSDGFETMSGYEAEEIVGRNCRFLSKGCEVSQSDRDGLREACRTGAPFATILENVRKTGERFKNHVDVRGLTVAHNLRTGEDLWYLIGIQLDVTEMDEDTHQHKLIQVARRIRQTLVQQLGELGVSVALACGRCIQFSIEGSESTQQHHGSTWTLCREAQWRPRVDQYVASLDGRSGASLDSLPSMDDGFSDLGWALASKNPTMESLPELDEMKESTDAPDLHSNAHDSGGLTLAPRTAALGTVVFLGVAVTLCSLRRIRGKG